MKGWTIATTEWRAGSSRGLGDCSNEPTSSDPDRCPLDREWDRRGALGKGKPGGGEGGRGGGLEQESEPEQEQDWCQGSGQGSRRASHSNSSNSL